MKLIADLLLMALLATGFIVFVGAIQREWRRLTRYRRRRK